MEQNLVNKAIRFYQYLEQLIKLRSSVVLNTNKYIDMVWLYEIPHDKYCHCAMWKVAGTENDPVWVEIKRPVLPKVPQLPKECINWVDSKELEDYKSIPVLLERIIKVYDVSNENPNGNLEYIELSNYPEVQQVWNNYLEKQWKVWAQNYGQVKEVQNIYAKLFNMFQQQKALGESYEVVIGIGLVNCKTKKGAQIYRHILYAQTELYFEPDNGTIIVRASSEGAKLHFETEMFDPSEQPPVEIQLQLEERLKDISDEIWEESIIHPVIRSWINSMDSKSEYNENIIPVKENNNSDNPTASFSPAIILRKRTNIGIIRFIKKIIEQLNQGKSIPSSMEIFLSIEESNNKNISGINDEEKEVDNTLKLPEKTYFPLLYNEEQFRIIKEINNKRGVLVQGPPGTGKSHTIANLISHFLATGKKVLVTSQTARALKVLSGKIPEQIQPLCVSILGSRQEDYDNLKRAVTEITNRYYSWDTEQNLKTIDKLEQEIIEIEKRLQETKVSLRELREKEIYEYSIIDGKFTGTAQAIAVKLSDSKNIYGWIPDEIASNELLPFSAVEFKKLIYLSGKFDDKFREELTLRRIKSVDIFTPEEFMETIKTEKQYKEKETQIQNNDDLKNLYNKLKKTNIDKRKNLLNSLKNLEKAKSEACRKQFSWIKDDICLILKDRSQQLRNSYVIAKKYSDDLKNKYILANDTDIKINNEVDIFKMKTDAEDLLQYLEAGKKLGWGIFKPSIYRKIKYLLKDVIVNGKSCNNIDCLKLLINYTDVKITLDRFKNIWKDKIEISGTIYNQVSIIEERIESIERILSIDYLLIEAKKNIKEIETISEPYWHEEKEIEKFIFVLETTFIIDHLNMVEEKINKTEIDLRCFTFNLYSHPVNKVLLESLETRNWNKWGEAYNKLLSLEKDQLDLDEYDNLLRRLKIKTPLLAELISNKTQCNILEEQSICFEEAWTWARGYTWLKEFEKTHNGYILQKEYELYEDKSRKTTAKLIQEKAWKYCFDDMTEGQRQHLVSWSQAIRRIGKGTGKWAYKHRKDAEFHMSQCREAIPVWIMPLYRVSETITPESEIFDVVIVDESSQCGSEALFLLYIAKKCIIVGDDQQISPEGVGIERQDVNLLIERFLKDIPHPDAYGVEGSLFSHAQIRYGARIVLREHFRCVPEIIQFSNDLCYRPLGAGLIPIRSYSSHQLNPSICDRYIRNGFREGYGQNVLNKPEAEALVEQIVECCKDISYKNKTIGVISLQGETQARYIERLLIEKIGPKEMEQRNLICGDAYDFQGDERDVIFLSMVAASNERIGPLTRETDKRRFNVAFSRAKDQIWLFHSVTLNDLIQEDNRYKLLSYCQNPLIPNRDLEYLNKIEEIRKIAKVNNRRKGNQPPPFDSWFEVDVFLKIIDRNYNAIPQFEVAEKRIDIVIEGVNRRLAIECDGDAWHGLEQYEHDQWRQRMLERANWKFFRIRGSIFYCNPEKALEPLWELLEEMRIYNKNQLKFMNSMGVGKNEVSGIIEEKQEEVEQREIEQEELEQEKLIKEELEQEELSGYMESKNYDKKDEDFKKAIINLLKEGSQGRDLISDKVLRSLNFTCRGRKRSKLRNKILKIVKDLQNQGIIKEYETDNRKRIRLL